MTFSPKAKKVKMIKMVPKANFDHFKIKIKDFDL